MPRLRSALHMKWRREEPRHTTLPYECQGRELSGAGAVSALATRPNKLKNPGSRAGVIHGTHDLTPECVNLQRQLPVFK